MTIQSICFIIILMIILCVLILKLQCGYWTYSPAISLGITPTLGPGVLLHFSLSAGPFMYYMLHTPSIVMNSSSSWLGVCGTWCVGGLVSLHAMFMTKCGSYPITVNWTQILICTILSGLSFSCPFWATIIFIVVGFCHVESFKPCIAVYFCTFLVPCF